MNLSDERKAPLRQFQNDQYALFLSLAAIGIPWELCAGALVECRERISISALQEKIELSADRNVRQYGKAGWLGEFLRRKQLSFRLFPNLVLLLCDLASGLERHERVEEASNLLRVAKEELLAFARENYATIGDVDKLVEMEMLMLEGQLLNLYLKGGLMAEASALFNLENEKPYLSMAVDKVGGLYGNKEGGKRSLVHEISGFFAQAAELERDGRFSLADKYYEQAIALLELELARGDQFVQSFLATLDYQVDCLLARRKFSLAERLVELQGRALSSYGSTWHQDFALFRQLSSLTAIYGATRRLDLSLDCARKAIALVRKYSLSKMPGLAWSQSLLSSSLADYYFLLREAQMPEAVEALNELKQAQDWQATFVARAVRLVEQGRLTACEAAVTGVNSDLLAYLEGLPVAESFSLSLTSASLPGMDADALYERAIQMAIDNEGAIRESLRQSGKNSEPLRTAAQLYLNHLEGTPGRGKSKRKKLLLGLIES